MMNTPGNLPPSPAIPSVVVKPPQPTMDTLVKLNRDVWVVHKGGKLLIAN